MKRIFLFFFILVLVFATYQFYSGLRSGSEPGTDFTDLPVIDYTNPDTEVNQRTDSQATMSLRTSEQVVTANNVMTLPTTVPLSADRFELRPDDAETFFLPFAITFNRRNDSFSVSLNERPFASTRREAELLLQAQLGVPQSVLCKLAIYVGVTAEVDVALSGQNLGLSFCAESVSLE